MSAPLTLPEWKSARMAGIGASESAAALGLNPYMSAAELLAIKTGAEEAPNLSGNIPVRWGVALEPKIADAYSRLTDRDLIDHGRYALRRHADFDFILATLDREIVPVDDNGPGILEIKSTQRRWDEGVPLHTQVQVQQQLAVTGWRWAEVATFSYRLRYDLFPRLFEAAYLARHERDAQIDMLLDDAIASVAEGDLQVFEIERDEAFIEGVLIPRLRTFWQHVLNREPLPEAWPG